jgi:hypothetical protein
MKKVLLAAAALACFGGTALAGTNANGTLIVSLADGVVYTTDILDYCGATGLQACGDAITRTDGADIAVLGVLGAFADGATPRVAGVTFGWTYSDVTLVAWGHCGDFELGTDTWPASGEGTAVTWAVAQTSQLIDIYWVAAYSYYGGGILGLGINPSQGADFADDSIPSVLDPIEGFGSFGFGVDGFLPCPIAPVFGACCAPDGTCEMTDRDNCTGEYQGDGTVCDPNPCHVPTGACCIQLECFILTMDECVAGGGDYIGDDVPCDDGTCVTPTLESSWGAIKGIYR